MSLSRVNYFGRAAGSIVRIIVVCLHSIAITVDFATVL